METSGTNGGAQGVGAGGSKIKQQRTDKNGKVVTRWVLANQSDNTKKRSSAIGDRGMPKINKPSKDKDVRRRKDRNSNGNAKKSEINRQRDEKAAIELVSSAQAKKDPNGAVKNLFESSMPESSSVEVDGRSVAITLGSGADVKITLDGKSPSGFSIDEDSSNALDEELTSSDQEAVETVIAELNALANLIETAGDSLNNLIDETASDVELEGLTDEAKEAISGLNQKEAKDSLDKKESLDTIKSFIEDEIKGSKVTSISENQVSIKRDSFTVKMEVKNSEDGKEGTGLEISDSTNKKMSEMAAKIKSGKGDTKALKEEFNKVVQLTQEVKDHFDENQDLYADKMFDKKAAKEEEKANKEKAKSEEKAKKEKAKEEEKAAKEKAKSEEKAKKDSKAKEDASDSDADKAEELKKNYDFQLSNSVESYSSFSNALSNLGISGKLSGQRLSQEDQAKVDRAYREAKESDKIGTKEKYTSRESYYKLRATTNKGDSTIIINNTPSSMKSKIKAVTGGALSAGSAAEFRRGPGGKAFETMNNNEKEFLAGMVNRIAQMRYGAASEVFKDSQVKVKEEK